MKMKNVVYIKQKNNIVEILAIVFADLGNFFRSHFFRQLY